MSKQEHYHTDSKHPLPIKKLRRPEVIALINMKSGQSLETDFNGMSAMVQYGMRHGIKVSVRRVSRTRLISKARWRVWKD